MSEHHEPADEVLLEGEGWTEVYRVGDTVRRPARPQTATVHAFLAYLNQRGFTGAPRPFGYDPKGREVLSYVDGVVPKEPLPGWAAGERQLAELARLIRRAHDAAEGWDPPPGAVFGSIPGPPQQGTEPLVAEPELVAHQDYCPGNVVFRGGMPAALIDFDLARPTTRVADAVNAMYWWAPLCHPQDRGPALAGADAARRVRIFADAYGMDEVQRSGIVDAALRRQRISAVTMRAAAESDPVFRRWWDEGMKDKLSRAESWLTAHAPALREALL
ncbi:aminoglycoside phosphotransferase family protein [Arthrobacter sp. ATA002]|uniref:phosphotransferase enzyme family protein n=1 Tax=Arthrobacter sp. ATA002 TaxID=2991715 RepID=UPI0022A67025|nr:aminoglycoside phosphotransferase family protein [Arthrobacter sp. ATA002]WAP53220.1 aminoglycoside phosphotransferase family protein [Arthrobacter sp. ATA002]